MCPAHTWLASARIRTLAYHFCVIQCNNLEQEGHYRGNCELVIRAYERGKYVLHKRETRDKTR